MRLAMVQPLLGALFLATAMVFLFSAPSNLLFPFCCSLGSFFVCFFSFGGISSGIFTFFLYSLAHFVII